MAEMLTVFNEEEKPIGIKEREDVHREGDWHETFHCWMFLRNECDIHLLFQQRAWDKKDFPGLYDITAAGHIEAEENLMDAGLREIEEELGLKLKAEDLLSIGRYREQLSHGKWDDREICRLYFFPCTSLPTFSVGEEVQDVVRVSLKEVASMLKGENTSVTAISVLNGKDQTLTKESFVPHEYGYMQYILHSVHSYITKL
ncbi:Isopentenyldiphosphate isomerase [Halobacillus dabanensis]|uniref:Isopentenyldiphosphate isomerase n=1 Tax=Halobacillus dabanensis TaxID=240302 RepID=A0A1I3Z2Q2_HALDA|nr:NUDIX domain-containing protein [Halobacillus dabanensis]SFK38310.1 Isopentenyldiphosphate isomerase [Halobacillus dabanensis]